MAAITRTSTWMVRVPAEPLDLALLERAQQLGLEIDPQAADLVEEERAAVGQLELAGLARVGAGEGALLVAEQLGLEQVSGIAARFTATKGWARRGLWLWMARATSSLPVPLSAVTSTVAWVCATWAIVS